MNERRVTFLEVGAVLAIAVLASWFRLSHLDLAEFKSDEATAVDLTLPIVDGRPWPQAGLISSVGIRNPPMLMYVLSLPLIVDVDPLVATAFVGVLSTLAVIGTYGVMRPRFGAFVALGSAALFATGPWAVLLGRKIWAQDLLPLFALLLLHCLFAIVERPRTWLAFYIPVLAGILCQLHLSALAAVPVVALVIIYAARRVRWTALGLGVAVAVVMAAPYLQYLLHDYGQEARALQDLARESSLRPASVLAPVIYTAHISGAQHWTYVTGASDADFTTAAVVVRRLAAMASMVVTVLLVAGVATVGAGLVRRVAAAPRTLRGLLDPHDESRVVLLLWLVGIWAVFMAARLDQLYPHYFVITYPAPFALAALALDDARRLAIGRWRTFATSVAATVIVAVCAAYGSFNLSFYRFVDANGGTAGDYGIAYTHKHALAMFALSNHLELAGAPPEVSQLVELERRYPAKYEQASATPVVPPAVVLEVRDGLQTSITCEPARTVTFGPLLGCLRP